ncbi:LolA family protein [Segatella bryantii]|nr:hypothetical protein [Segatella bryantii]SDL93290.1 hypothetical protein SAMN04487899_11031 [Segatella bryantii]
MKLHTNNHYHTFRTKWLSLRTKYTCILLLLFFSGTTMRADNNAEEARKLFNSVYHMVFGPEGSTLSYDVNIIGLYKTKGTIWYKGKKSRYTEARYMSWNNGVTAYQVDKKKKTVGIYRADDDSKDKYLSKFKYDLNDYIYSWSYCKDGIQICLKPKSSKIFGIRQAIGVIDKKTHYPLYLRIKVAFFWTTVKIFDFKAGNIHDSIFHYPAANFKGYTIEDHRKK